MNILYHFRTRGTGAEAVHIAGIAGAFEKLGHHVVFSSPTGVDPRLSAGSSPYQRSTNKSLAARLYVHCPNLIFELLEIGYNLVAWRKNRAILKQSKISLIYERHALFLVSTSLLARKYNIPLIVEVNELVSDSRVRKQPWLGSLAAYFDKVLFRQAALIVVVSPHLKRRIEALGVSGNKVLILPNAVNEEFTRPADGSTIRARMGVSNEIVIGFIGWFVEWHRLDILLDVFSGLTETRSHLRLALVGEGPLRKSLEDQARRLGIMDRIIFTGPLPYQEIPAAIAGMDICVVPHSNEYRSPIKMFEYMSQGKLVVAPATEPVTMVLRHRENALLFKPGDTASLATMLADAADNAGLRRIAGLQAHQDVLDHHTWLRNAETVLANLRSEGNSL